MNDIVAVALISAGSSILGASVGALTTYKISLRNAETTVATATSQHEVELAKIEAENQRLRQTNQEEERRNRQSNYHQHLVILHELYVLMGFAASTERINDVRNDYRNLHAGVVLFAPSSVKAAAYELGRVYNEIEPALEEQRETHSSKTESECWRDATAGIKDRFGEEIVNLTTQMHADVTRGISEDPENR